MSNENNAMFSGVFTPDLGELKKHWGWLMTLGIVFTILGTIGLGMQYFLTIVSVLFFGILLLIGGGFQVAHAFTCCKGWKGKISHIVIALLYIGTGTVMINNPQVASALLTLIIGLLFISIGILRSISALQHRATRGWVVSLFSGILGIAVGFMIMASWPYSGLWVIGLFVAVELIIAGFSYIFLALSVKRMTDDTTEQNAVPGS